MKLALPIPNWVTGILMIFLELVALTSSISQGIIFILIALLFLPPTYNLLKDLSQIHASSKGF